jgi:hypothetical protein
MCFEMGLPFQQQEELAFLSMRHICYYYLASVTSGVNSEVVHNIPFSQCKSKVVIKPVRSKATRINVDRERNTKCTHATFLSL